MPAISVVVPVYNVEKYIHRCVDSILAQTFTDFELILVDDGSPDNCPAICDEYAAKDKRVRVIHQENGGVSRARNAALDVAKGRYIAFCDSDDYLSIDFLETLRSSFNDFELHLVISNYTAVDENEAVLWKTKYSQETLRLSSESEICDYIIKYVLRGKTGWELCKNMFLAEIIQKKKIRFNLECNNYAEDVGFLMQYCLHTKKIQTLDYNGYFYFIHPKSMVRSNLKIAKIQEKNEVSLYFSKYFFSVVSSPELQKRYPVIHYLLMCGEYEKLIGEKRWAELPATIRQVKNKEWYQQQVKGIWKCKGYLLGFLGKKETVQIMLISSFCLHKSWVRFRFERAIFNRLVFPYLSSLGE